MQSLTPTSDTNPGANKQPGRAAMGQSRATSDRIGEKAHLFMGFGGFRGRKKKRDKSRGTAVFQGVIGANSNRQKTMNALILFPPATGGPGGCQEVTCGD